MEVQLYQKAEKHTFDNLLLFLGNLSSHRYLASYKISVGKKKRDVIEYSIGNIYIFNTSRMFTMH